MKDGCHSTKHCCRKFRLCLTKIAGWGLILWGIGYTINSLVQVYHMCEHYSTWILVKHFIHRLGPSFAAILLSSLVLHVLAEEECGDEASDCCADDEKTDKPAGGCCGGHDDHHHHDHHS